MSQVYGGWFGRCVIFFLVIGCAWILWPLILSPQAQSNTALSHQLAASSADEAADGFVTYQTNTGTAVRQIAEVTARRMQAEQKKAQLHAISAGDFAASAERTVRQGFQLYLYGTSQLDNFPEAKAAFQRAAARWQALLRSNANVEVNIDFGPKLFGSDFDTPDTLAVTLVRSAVLSNAGVALPTLLADNAANEQQEAIFNSLPKDFVETDFGRTNSYRIPHPILQALGVFAGVSLPAHSIGFNSAFNFDFDPRDGVEPGKVDFEALVTRELGHILGFTSSAGNQEVNLTEPTRLSLWDLFRFRPNIDSFSISAGARVLSSGGEQVYYTGNILLPLSTGRPDGSGGDGNPSAHWKDNALTGRTLGIMDPTFAAGERGVITPNDLLALSYMGHEIDFEAVAAEVLSITDATPDETVALNGAMIVNRLTPTRAPFKLESVRIQLPITGAPPIGASLRVVAWADASRSGKPAAQGQIAPPFLIDRTFTIPAIPANGLLEVLLPERPSFTGGDLYIGVQSTNANVRIGADRSHDRQHVSFISNDNGVSFIPLQNAAQAPLNLNLQAVVIAGYNGEINPTPAVETVSPVTAVAGGQDFTLHVFGNRFFPETKDRRGFLFNSIVRWNGENRGTSFLSDNVLLATISAADIATAGNARITVFTPTETGGLESPSLEFTITPNRPVPRLTTVEPNQGIVGSESLKLRVYGADFTAGAVVRWNGSNRPTTLINSVELQAELSAADLANPGSAEITVFTPTPGGGASSPAVFSVTPCGYTLSHQTQSFRTRTFNDITVRLGGVIVTPAGQGAQCPWTAQTNVPWLTELKPTTGTGKTAVTFRVLNNPGAARVGTVTVGNSTLTIRQNGVATGVSAASYAELVAPNSIASVFGSGLANAIQVATGTTLPNQLAGVTAQFTNRNGTSYPAQLFFVSPQQVNLLAPADMPVLAAPFPDDYLLSVLVNGQFVAENIVSIAAVAPAFFTADTSGQGLPAAVVFRLKADGTQSYEALAEFDPTQNRFVPKPIDLGPETDQVFLLLFGTGIRGRTSLDAVTMKIGGVNVPVSFASAQGDFVGLDQINVQLPRGLKGKGAVTINCSVDTRNANPVTVTIK